MAFTSFGQVIPVTGPNIGFPGDISRQGVPVVKARQVLPTTPNNLAFGAPAVLIGQSIGGANSQGGYWQSVLDYLTAPAVTVNAATINANPIITVASAAGLVVGMAASGTGIGSLAVITAINGLAVTLSANSTATSATVVAVTFAIPAKNAQYILSVFAGFAVREVKTNLTYQAGLTPGLQQVGYYAPGERAEVMELGSMTVPVAYGTPTSNSAVYLRLVANGSLSGTAVGDIEAANDVAATTTFGSTIGSADITVNSATSIAIGQVAAGAGIPENSIVIGINSTTITLNKLAQATIASGMAVTFSNTIALPDCVFGSGYEDANGIAEVTLLRRRAA
jgi:hypothetical protein